MKNTSGLVSVLLALLMSPDLGLGGFFFGASRLPSLHRTVTTASYCAASNSASSEDWLTAYYDKRLADDRSMRIIAMVLALRCIRHWRRDKSGR